MLTAVIAIAQAILILIISLYVKRSLALAREIQVRSKLTDDVITKLFIEAEKQNVKLSFMYEKLETMKEAQGKLETQLGL